MGGFTMNGKWKSRFFFVYYGDEYTYPSVWYKMDIADNRVPDLKPIADDVALLIASFRFSLDASLYISVELFPYFKIYPRILHPD